MKDGESGDAAVFSRSGSLPAGRRTDPATPARSHQPEKRSLILCGSSNVPPSSTDRGRGEGRDMSSKVGPLLDRLALSGTGPTRGMEVGREGGGDSMMVARGLKGASVAAGEMRSMLTSRVYMCDRRIGVVDSGPSWLSACGSGVGGAESAKGESIVLCL